MSDRHATSESVDSTPERPPRPRRLVVGQGEQDTLELGRLVRQARKRLGVSAMDLADKLGLSVSFVRAIERGERAPAPPVAADLLEALGASVSWADRGTGVGADLVWRDETGRQVRLEFKHWNGSDGGASASMTRLKPWQPGSRSNPVLGVAGSAGVMGATVALDAAMARVARRMDGERQQRREHGDMDALLGRVTRQLSTSTIDQLNVIADLIQRLLTAANDDAAARVIGAVAAALDDGS